MTWRTIKSNLWLLLILMGLAACICAEVPKYGFRPPVSVDVNSMAVNTFESNISNGPANIEIQFTEKLKTYFQKNTKIQVVDPNGGNPDIVYAGSIESYVVQPVASNGNNSGTQQATQQQLTIGVKVNYVNYKLEKDTTLRFSFFKTFDASLSLSDVESGLIEDIFEQIINDIFNATVADW